jgi:hypothetical protein
MKVEVNQPLKDLEGKVINKDTEKKIEFQLKDACVNALMAEIEGEKIDGNEKVSRYLLATKIQKANELDLKSEEIAKIKDLIGKVYGVLVVGQCFEMLEKE